jgi:hypothetical protein
LLDQCSGCFGCGGDLEDGGCGVVGVDPQFVDEGFAEGFAFGCGAGDDDLEGVGGVGQAVAGPDDLALAVVVDLRLTNSAPGRGRCGGDLIEAAGGHGGSGVGDRQHPGKDVRRRGGIE